MSDSLFVIAEMACAHDGSLDNALTIVKGAFDAGANAIQFQIWNPLECVAPNHKDFELLQGIELGYDNWKRLIEFTQKETPGLEIIACVYGVESTKFAADLGVNAFKVHTSDLGNPVLLDTCSRLADRIDLSVGGSYDSEIKTALEIIRQHADTDTWLMYGIQLFPTPVDAINLNRMHHLKNEFSCVVGFQDHSNPESPESYCVPASALAAGVNVIEKHITHDRSKKGVDSQAALNPNEFKHFVQVMQNISVFAAPSSGELSKGEERYRQYSKKQILAASALQLGHAVEPKDLLFSRPAEYVETGFSPEQSGGLIGKQLSCDIPAFTPFTQKHFEQ